MKEFILALALFLIWIANAHAQWGVTYIQNDPGGLIDDYTAKYQALKMAGTPVVIAGSCASACTLVLMLPRSQVCARPEGILGFHAGYILGIEKPNKTATAHLTRYYPSAVRKWFYSRPLSLNIRWRRATDFFPLCR